MLTILTQSNKSSTSIMKEELHLPEHEKQFWNAEFEQANKLDQEIQVKIFNQIKAFTTFSLDRNTFVQVFEDSKSDLSS